MPKIQEEKENISQQLEKINYSLKGIKRPTKVEIIMLFVAISSLVISLYALSSSEIQFKIWKYEKEPRVVNYEYKCENEFQDDMFTYITLENYGLLTVYNLKITTEGFKCARGITSYSDYYDYYKYNETSCSAPFTIGQNQPSTINFLLIANKTYNGTIKYNIDYEYQTFSENKKIHVKSCEFEKRNNKYYLINEY
jgi:hypothetical protein